MPGLYLDGHFFAPQLGKTRDKINRLIDFMPIFCYIIFVGQKWKNRYENERFQK